MEMYIRLKAFLYLLTASQCHLIRIMFILFVIRTADVTLCGKQQNEIKLTTL